MSQTLHLSEKATDLMNRFKPDIESYRSDSLSETWLQEVYRLKWFKLFIPKEFDGRELSLPEALIELTDAATVQGSLGWAVNLGSGAGYFYRFFEKSVSRELFSPEKAVIAGSGKLTGVAQHRNSGYALSGTWDKCSGSAHATMFTVGAPVDKGNSRCFVLKPEQVSRENSWNMFALKGTSSFSISVQDAFVPEELAFDIGVCCFDDDYRISEMPFEIFSRFCLLASMFGMARCFIFHLDAEFSGRPISFFDQVSPLISLVDEGVQSTLALAGEYWARLQEGQVFGEEETLRLRAHVQHFSQPVYQQCCELFYKMGMGLSDENSLAHNALRDVLLGCQHYMLK